jgi:hypothetical protein
MQDIHAHRQSNLDPCHKDQLPVILSFIDDSRRLIEAGKGRRWEVFKWAVAINLLLVPTAFAHEKFPFPAVAFDIISGVSSLLAIALILHYDRRIDGARRRSHGLIRWIAANIIDVSAVTGIPEDRDHPRQDAHENALFCSSIVLTWIIVVLAACYQVAA